MAQSPWDQETTLKDQEFKKSRENSLSYIGKKNRDSRLTSTD